MSSHISVQLDTQLNPRHTQKMAIVKIIKPICHWHDFYFVIQINGVVFQAFLNK